MPESGTEVAEPAPAPEAPKPTCTYCLCEITAQGFVDMDYSCGQHACPTGGCVPAR